MKKIYYLAFLMAFSVATTNSFSQGTWTQKADFGGAARYWASGFSINGKVYIGVGYNPSPMTMYKDFWEYDPANNTWTQKANYPGGGSLYVSGFSIGNKGYFGCGWDNGYKNDFWEYDPANNTWTQKANFPGVERWGATGFSIGTKGYIGVGDALGNGNGCQSDFYEYDQTTNTWTQKSYFPGTAVYGAAGFSIGTKGYIGTGYDGTNVHNEFYEWDQASNTWSQKANFGGAARYQDAGFAIGTKGYIGTGSHGGNDFWAWDQATNTWTVQTPFPGSAANVCTGVSSGGLGYIGTGQSATRQFWEFMPSPCPAVAVTLTAGGATVFCQGDSVTLNSGSNHPSYSYSWFHNGSPISGAISSSYHVTQSGAYTLQIDSAGCTGVSAPISVTVNPLPTVTINSIPSIINYYEAPISLSGVPAGGTFSGSGVTGNQFSPGAAGLGYHQLTYQYTDINNCSNLSAASTLVYDTTGVLCTTYDTITVQVLDTTYVTINDTTYLTVYDTIYVSVTDTLIINAILTGILPPNNTNTLKIYPNPAMTHITIDNGTYLSMSGYALRIDNSSSQTVFTSPINQSSFFINLSGWTGSGLYFVYIIDNFGNTIEVKKIVLQ